jgi:hypothetical protein
LRAELVVTVVSGYVIAGLVQVDTLARNAKLRTVYVIHIRNRELVCELDYLLHVCEAPQ